ncbi:hypothetical protein D3C72_379490 [compost metagenome]
MTTGTLSAIAFEPIECEYFDKENLGWAKAYIAKNQQRLDEGGEELAPEMRRFVETEIAAYQELIDRFSK